MDKETIIFTKKKNKKTLFNFQIDWRLVLSLFILIFIFAVVPGINKHVKKISLINSDITNVIFFCHFLLVINYFILTFTITNYFARIYKKGPKGYKGKLGKTGQQGDNEKCDIKSFKTGVFKREEDRSKEAEIIDDSLTKKGSFIENKKWNYISNIEDIDKGLETFGYIRDSDSKKYAPDDLKNVITIKLDKEKDIYSDTYLNGAIVGWDKDHGDINAIQFMENLHKVPDNTDLQFNIIGNKFGNEEAIDKDTENKDNNTTDTIDFNCPANSGIYKIKLTTNPEGTINNKDVAEYVNGIKFYCKDVTTGENVNIVTSDNEIVDGINLGNDVELDSTVSVFECPHDETTNNKPSFINGLSVSDSDKKIHGFRINSCSYYDNYNDNDNNN